MRGAEKCIRELRTDNKQLQTKMKSTQSDAAKIIEDFEKIVEDLEAKLKGAESGKHILGKRLQQLIQNRDQEIGGVSASEKGNGLKTEGSRDEESSILTTKVTELESALSKTQESLVLITRSRDAAVQGGIQLEFEYRSKLNQMETAAKERDEHISLLSDQFAAKHQQLIDHQQSTQAELEKRSEENKSLKRKHNQHQSLRDQHEKTNAQLSEIITEKEGLAKELQDTVDRLKNETDQNKKLKSELSKIQTLLEQNTPAQNSNSPERQYAGMELKTQAKEKELNDVKHKLTLLKEMHETKVKPTQEESSQTDPNDFGPKSVQMSEMEVEFLNLLSAKDEQIAKLNDMLAKVQHVLEEFRGLQ